MATDERFGNPMEVSRTQAAESNFFSRVYLWMAGGLFLSAGGALMTLSSEPILRALVSPQGKPSFVWWALAIGELLLVMWLSRAIHTISVGTAGGAFALYSVLNGVTLSLIFLAYTASSIALTFAIAAGTFLFFSVYGYFTKQNLAGVRGVAQMAVIGIIIATLVNMFIQSRAFDYVLSYIGIAVFIALTAADTQKLKQFFYEGTHARDTLARVAILGALQLYLDFINLFLFLLRLFGSRRN